MDEKLHGCMDAWWNGGMVIGRMVIGVETQNLTSLRFTPQAFKTCPKGTTIHHSSIIIQKCHATILFVSSCLGG